MNSERAPDIVMIPVEHIRVVNPRVREKRKFQQIVHSIARLGLKKPITVNPRNQAVEDGLYDLVCGQGRLEAYIALGQKEIPAVIVDVPKEDRFLMSLVENIARRKHTSLETAHEVAAMRERKMSVAEIAAKTGLTEEYVRAILRLLEQGEERLLAAVEAQQLPVSVAVAMASSNDAAMQHALLEAYDSKRLQGTALLRARRLMEQRQAKGKTLRGKQPTAVALVRVYRRESERQKQVVHKAKVCEGRLLFIVSALKQLFEDENFINLLRAEKLASLPKYLAAEIFDGGNRRG